MNKYGLCPICGDENVYLREKNVNCGHGLNITEYRVCCKECGASTEWHGMWNDAKEKAENDWAKKNIFVTLSYEKYKTLKR